MVSKYIIGMIPDLQGQVLYFKLYLLIFISSFSFRNKEVCGVLKFYVDRNRTSLRRPELRSCKVLKAEQAYSLYFCI